MTRVRGNAEKGTMMNSLWATRRSRVLSVMALAAVVGLPMALFERELFFGRGGVFLALFATVWLLLAMFGPPRDAPSD